jgi:hypothetical protein
VGGSDSNSDRHPRLSDRFSATLILKMQRNIPHISTSYTRHAYHSTHLYLLHPACLSFHTSLPLTPGIPIVPHTFNIHFCNGCSASPFNTSCLVIHNVATSFYSCSQSFHKASNAFHPSCRSFHTASLPFYFTCLSFYTFPISF